MSLLSSPLALAPLFLLIALHAAAVFLPERIGKILQYVNICLHILYLVPLLCAHIPLDEAVLAYLISVFFYTVFSGVRLKIAARAKTDREEETK